MSATCIFIHIPLFDNNSVTLGHTQDLLMPFSINFSLALIDFGTQEGFAVLPVCEKVCLTIPDTFPPVFVVFTPL